MNLKDYFKKLILSIKQSFQTYMTLCGIDCWGKSVELGDVLDYIYLASLTT